jgi:hypothetical protein
MSSTSIIRMLLLVFALEATSAPTLRHSKLSVFGIRS